LIRVPLRLRPSTRAAREADGWYVASPDPAAWLEAVSLLGARSASAVFRPLPASAADRRPAGALVTIEGPSPLRPGTAAPARLEPWTCVAGKLWMPCRARLEPEATEGEIRAFVAGECAILHPAVGLVEFRAEDALRATDLLEAPPPQASDWARARDGRKPAPRLSSASPEVVARIEVFMAESRSDIGTKPPDALPPEPGEMKTPGRPPGWIGRQVARGLHFLTGLAPGGAASPTWIDRLREWSRSRLEQVGADLRSARDREIARLMKLLDSDPDNGLRFALPIGSGNDIRGFSAPGSSLGPRDTTFSLSRLGGGHAADPWDLDWKTQNELTRRYRDLAVRELRLGRHRRAAYIFAELLGDLRAAADALCEGRHYREAAVLYRDRLRQPLQAAQCLEKGGLLVEAIALYETEGRWETAGDLYARLDRRDDAARAWRQAVSRHNDKGDPLSAGRLLEGKLAAPADALALWESTWPWSHQAGPCLDARFDLLGRLGRHEDANALVARLRDEPLPPSRILTSARALSGLVATYPDRPVRDAAADAARVTVGKRLPGADASEAEELLKVVARLAPEDRLLGRDAARFSLARHKLEPRPAPHPTNIWTPLLSCQIQLPGDIMWETAAARDDLLYVAGFGRGGAVLARCPWSEQVQVLTWTPQLNYPHILEPGLDPYHPVLFAGSPGPRLGLLSFPKSESVPAETPAGTPPWFPDNVLGAAVAELRTVWVVLEHLGRLVVWAYTQSGAISAVYPLPQLEEAIPDGETLAGLAPIPCVAHRLNLFAAVGHRVVRLGRDGAVTTLDLTFPVSSLHGYGNASRPMIAAGFESGGALVFDGPDLANVRHFGDDLAEPLLTFTRDGTLVAVGEREGRIYDTADGRLVEKASFPVIGGRPLAAVRGPKGNEFALVMPMGKVWVYTIPGRKG
jgi:tetratricopeptide (TPR) repeat protein